jgi:hypothetical protein
VLDLEPEPIDDDAPWKETHRHLSNAGKNEMVGGALLIVSQRELEFRNNRMFGRNSVYVLCSRIKWLDMIIWRGQCSSSVMCIFRNETWISLP